MTSTDPSPGDVRQHAGEDGADAGAAELAAVVARLEARFCPPLPLAAVHRCVAEAIESLRSARIRRFVALLVERSATERLRAQVADVNARQLDRPSAGQSVGPRHDASPTGAEQVPMPRFAPPSAMSRPWWRLGRTTRPSQPDRTPLLLGATATEQPLEA